MNTARIVLTALGTTALSLAMGGCDVAQTEAATQTATRTDTQYGSFTYAPPSGWGQYEPPPGVLFAEGMFEFRPEGTDGPDAQDAPRLEVREVTDGVERSERIPGRFALLREWMMQTRFEQAVGGGQPPITFTCEPIAPAITAPGEADGLSIVTVQGTREQREIVHWIKLSDGRRFRARYTGVEPSFSEHEAAITASLATLTFPPDESVLPPLSRDEIVSALMEQLDDDRLWISDGKLRGRPLNDRHLEALADPAFAEVTDFNVNPQSASTDGVEVTDEGLRHLAHLPLETLCLRGSLVTDEGLVHLKDLPLKMLVLGETLIEGDGLRHLSGMKLMLIDVAGTGVGDDAIEHLRDMPLAQIWIRNTRITDAGLAQLAEYLPDAHVAN